MQAIFITGGASGIGAATARRAWLCAAATAGKQKIMTAAATITMIQARLATDVIGQ